MKKSVLLLFILAGAIANAQIIELKSPASILATA
jgi:hypothetical protein